jgi:preprotein translocase subunit YajC
MSAHYFQKAEPKQGTLGTTQDTGTPSAAAPASPLGGAVMWLPMLALLPILFMSFRRQKKEQEARKNLKKGDRVVTTAGLLGELIEIDERLAKVKIAPGTTVQVLASALSSFEAAPAANKTDKELADLKEAKATADKK